MAAPTYNTDLTLLDNADTNIWVEPTGMTAGTIVSPETDFFIQGTGCAAKYMTSGGTGLGALVRDNGSGVTIPTPGGFFIWIYPQGVNQLNDFANGGIRLIVGSSTANYYAWRVAGDDTIPYGGWTCWVVDPSAPTPVTDDGTGLDADYQVGTPSGTTQVFGAGVNQQVNAKGGTGFDVMRYGRGELKVEFGAVADGFATFAGAAAQNDTNANRWGLFQAIAGGYLYKGLLLFGSVTNAVDFRDSNTSILVENTARVTANFNTIEIRNASSRVDWTSISFLALGTVARGNFIVTDNATVNWIGCTFTDVGTFNLLAATTATNSVFRRTDKITLGGATLTGCTIDNNRATTAVLAATPAGAALVSGCAFTSDGTGHGLEIGGTAANMTLTNCTWTGYASSDGSTGNEAVFVNIASGSMNLTISGGTTPSVRTAGATVTVISGAVSASVNVKNSSDANIENARVFVKAATGGPFPFDVTVTISNSGTTATVTHTAHAMATNDKVVISGASLEANNGIFTITRIDANSYSYTMGSTPGSSPTGTIKCTFVVLSGLTDVSGNITMSRVFSADQPITGWARKASATPFYKTGTIGGSVDSATGYSANLILILDE